jgi:hypothetical protein
MKDLFSSITNSANLLDVGYSYDRTRFYAGHGWQRSFISGAITAGLTAVSIYTGFLAADAQFATALGAQAANFTLASGAVAASMLAYSLRDLFRSITQDVKTELRVVRANSWLTKGDASNFDQSEVIKVQQTSLGMVRYAPVDGGIKCFALACHPDYEHPFLLEALLFDDEYPALATFYTEEADIRSLLGEACGEWSNIVARRLGISFTPKAQQGAEVAHDRAALDDFDAALAEQLDDDASEFSKPASEDVFGRASAPRNARAELVLALSKVPPEAITH